MDGTIVDTEHIWKEATHQLITRRGVAITQDLSKELSHRLNGMALPQSCMIIKEITQSVEPVEALIAEKSNLACQLYEQGHVKFIEGFTTFHEQVVALEMKISIATNANDATLELTDKMLNLKRYFGEHMYNLSKVSKGKPHPDIYLLAARQIGVAPELCIAIEDSAHGIAAAKAAGMFCIGINTSGNPEQIKQADLKIDRYEEIILQDLLELPKKN